MTAETLIVGGTIMLFIVFGALIMAMKFFQKVEQGKAMIVNTMRDRPHVTFTGRIVLPVIHKAETMDISVKRIVITRKAHEGLICKDNIRADISVNFFIRVNPTEDDVLHVASHIGCARASDELTLDELFNAKFAEALKTVGKQLDFESLYQEREQFRDAIKRMVANDLNGYRLEDVAIDYLEQTPISELDDNNILDSQGIRKITELTAGQRVAANDARRNEQKSIKKQDVEAQETILELERQQADAEAKQRREIDTTVAREQAATAAVQEEERLRAEQARIRTDQQIAIEEENQHRELEVAAQERLRVVAIKEEEVKRARDLEAVARIEEVSLREVARDRAVEEQRRAVVAQQREVAEEEERIKEVREISAAERERRTRVIEAEAAAEESLVKQLKQAEADEKAARHEAQRSIALAEAELETSAKQSEAMKVLAEGEMAEKAAEGLAEARVRDAKAAADEKYGRAQAEVTREQLLAEARGEEEKGLAAARVERERRGAEAEGVERMGQAEAVAIRERYEAEAAGLMEKFKALAQLDESGRLHEEFRMELEKTRDIQSQAITANQELGRHQAQVLAEAFKSANINIVGGDGAFFDRMVGAISGGKAIDAALTNSNVLQSVAGGYLNGEKDLATDLKELITNAGIDTNDIKNLSVSAALTKLMSKGNAEQQSKIQELLKQAQSLGLN
ncbi:hypothetical protein CAI21_07805 [Alkalilimnicola ehrlichii]|uniref:Band 7 domain-containing protein n=1 Tax=Alkalilimnicola ehrlichii TaxID=351052 RepID=A0A3E0WZ29_9GAMM|nr:hypothetical protein [Alkalilimnicola ehrlichii]RFA30096.1 hypothetical protein CAI21_07805 [Alkalilimnicola ehrlichii]RFA37441.1 hypothetical protein CAL65_09145 [Alkalilimnicola ehrlichii]